MTEQITRPFIVMPAGDEFPGDSCRVVDAASEEEAVGLYVERVLALQDDWLEQVYSHTSGGSVASRFFGGPGIPLIDEQGEYRANEDEARQTSERNVRAFFGSHAEWAESYFQFLYHNMDTEWRTAMATWLFPPEMVGYMLRHQRRAWCEIVAVALDDIEHIA